MAVCKTLANISLRTSHQFWTTSRVSVGLNVLIFVLACCASFSTAAQAARLGEAAYKELQNRIHTFRTEGKPLQALDLLDSTLSTMPEDARAHRLRGGVLLDLGRYDEAVSAAKRSVTLDPASSANWNTLCWSQVLVNRQSEARTACEQALALDSDSVAARINLGHTWLLQGNISKAEEGYLEVLFNSSPDHLRNIISDLALFVELDMQRDLAAAADIWVRSRWQLVRDVVKHFEEMEPLQDAGRLEEALVHAVEIEVICKQLDCISHPKAAVLHIFAPALYFRTGNTPRAIELVEEKISALNGIKSSDPATTGRLLHFFAGLYIAVDLKDRALPLSIRALENYITSGREDLIAECLVQIAKIYSTSGELQSALQLQQRALALAERSIGKTDPKTREMVEDLALLLYRLNDFEKALPLFERALLEVEQSDGPSHQNTFNRVQNLAETHLALGHIEQAVSLFERSITIYERIPDHNKQYLSKLLNNLAELHHRGGHDKVALKLYLRALTSLDGIGDGKTPDSRQLLIDISSLYVKAEEYRLALPILERLLSTEEAKQGQKHSSLVPVLKSLAQTYEALGNPSKATPLYKRALAINEDSSTSSEISKAPSKNTLRRIEVTSPLSNNRGARSVQTLIVHLEGSVLSEVGPSRVEVNQQIAELSADGKFRIRIALKRGDNRVPIVAWFGENDFIQTAVSVTAVEEGPSPVGRSYALVIGNNSYRDFNWPRLQTPRGDAEAIARLLSEKYGFLIEVPPTDGKPQPLLLLDATRSETTRALSSLRRILRPEDSLVIFFAGHGVFENETELAFWLPIDAEKDEPQTWLSASEILAAIQRMSARHILVVADSCFSGAIIQRSGTSPIFEVPLSRSQSLLKMSQRISRRVLTSGANEPVTDGGGNSHSIFAQALIDGLKSESQPFTATELFVRHLLPTVSENSRQLPQQAPLTRQGHAGGDFIFFPNAFSGAATR